jgi:hypothetical protein
LLPHRFSKNLQPLTLTHVIAHPRGSIMHMRGHHMHIKDGNKWARHSLLQDSILIYARRRLPAFKRKLLRWGSFHWSSAFWTIFTFIPSLVNTHVANKVQLFWQPTKFTC